MYNRLCLFSAVYSLTPSPIDSATLVGVLFTHLGCVDLHCVKEVEKEGRTKGQQEERIRELEKCRMRGQCETYTKKGKE